MQKYTRFQDIPQFTQAGSWQADFPLEHVMGFINSEIDEMGLLLNPDFQRGHVWTDEQQIAWLEYFLKGGKTGKSYRKNINTTGKCAYHPEVKCICCNPTCHYNVSIDNELEEEIENRFRRIFILLNFTFYEQREEIICQ